MKIVLVKVLFRICSTPRVMFSNEEWLQQHYKFQENTIISYDDKVDATKNYLPMTRN